MAKYVNKVIVLFKLVEDIEKDINNLYSNDNKIYNNEEKSITRPRPTGHTPSHRGADQDVYLVGAHESPSAFFAASVPRTRSNQRRGG